MDVERAIQCKGCGETGRVILGGGFQPAGTPYRVSGAFYLHRTDGPIKQTRIACTRCQQIHALD